MITTNVQSTWMKKYTVPAESVMLIRNLFWKYLFGNVIDGQGYIKCSTKQRERIINQLGIVPEIVN